VMTGAIEKESKLKFEGIEMRGLQQYILSS
jgi:hypothetical protein